MAESRARNRDFAILFLVMLITGAGNTALQSVLPAIGRTLQVPDSVIATIFSISALLWVFSAPYWAKRSDRQGRRKMVLLGSAGFTISTLLVGVLLYAGIAGWVTPIVAVMGVVVSRMIFGTFGSAAPPAAQAIIVLQTPIEERTKALSLLSSAFGLGTLLGLGLAPWLVLPVVGLAGPPFAFALIGAITLFLVARYLSEDRPEMGSKGANFSYPSIGGAPAGANVAAAEAEPVSDNLAMRDPRIWPWMLSGLVMGHAQAMTGSAMGFLVIDRLNLAVTEFATQQSIGLVLMSGAGAALLVQWGIIPTLNLKPRTMMLVGIGIAAFGLFAGAFAHSLYAIATTYALASAGFGFTRPAVTAGSSFAVSRRLQGLVAGRVTSVNGASFILGPTIGVGLYSLWGPLPYLVAAIVMLAMIPYVLARISSSDPVELSSPQ